MLVAALFTTGASLIAQLIHKFMKHSILFFLGSSLVAQSLKSLLTMLETQVQSLGQEDPLEKEMATHSRILAWRILWTEEPKGLQSIRLQSRTQMSDFHSFYSLSHFLFTIAKTWLPGMNRENVIQIYNGNCGAAELFDVF